MSEPHPPSSTLFLDHQSHPPPQPQPPSLPLPGPTSLPSSYTREYRKGNWTLHETLLLITAKRLDDDRRSRAGSSAKSPELRWKWVENYCWAHGCHRSQNQCNDKWDNLLRDYKKVKEYQSRCRSDGSDRSTYWKMDKQERKEKSLPSNLALEVFEALQEVVTCRQPSQSTTTPAAASTSAVATLAPPLPPPPMTRNLPPGASVATASDSSETEGNDRADSETKRQKLGRLGSSIVGSASILARTLLACEEKKEKRHREMLEVEERKLQMEESRTEAHRQDVAGLISAVNNLSGAILAVAANRSDTR